MADEKFDILIRVLTEQVGNEKATAILDKVKEATREAGKEGVKQEEEVRRATEKTLGSKRQLQGVLRQLGRGFPALSGVARAALSPITLAVMAIGASFTIMARKTAEATRAMGGFELPSISETAVELMERFQRASAQVKSNLADVKAQLDDFNQRQDILEAFAKGAGMDLDAAQAKRSQAAQEAGDLSAFEAARLRAAAGPGGFSADNAAAGKIPDLLKSLQDQKTKNDEQIKFLTEFVDAPLWKRTLMAPQMLARFGWSNAWEKMEFYNEQNRGLTAQIGGLTEVGRRRSERGGQISAADAAEAQASQFYRQSVGLDTGRASAAGADFIKAAGAIDPSSIVSLIESSVKIAAATAKGAELQRQALAKQEEANAAMERRINTQNQKP